MPGHKIYKTTKKGKKMANTVKQQRTRAGLIQYNIHPKQQLLNFVEVREYIKFRFYESEYFYNVEILMATEFAIKSILEDLPKHIMCHINASSNRFELFIDK